MKVTNYRLWVNAERTVLVRLWDDGSLEVAVRPSPEHSWGPPFWLREERSHDLAVDPGAGLGDGGDAHPHRGRRHGGPPGTPMMTADELSEWIRRYRQRTDLRYMEGVTPEQLRPPCPVCTGAGWLHGCPMCGTRSPDG